MLEDKTKMEHPEYYTAKAGDPGVQNYGFLDVVLDRLHNTSYRLRATEISLNNILSDVFGKEVSEEVDKSIIAEGELPKAEKIIKQIDDLEILAYRLESNLKDLSNTI